MNSLRIQEKVSRNTDFNNAVKYKKIRLIENAIALNGYNVQGSFDFHTMWESKDGKYRVGVGKYGKEYYSDSIRWKDGHKGNNPNDMRPTIWKDDAAIEFDGSFDHVFNFFQQVSKIDSRALEILGCLMVRNAYLLDHDDSLQYAPPAEAIEYLNSVISEYEGISVEAYLHYLEMIALNEDVKYYTLGYDVHSGTGRKNNLLTYAHLICNRQDFI